MLAASIQNITWNVFMRPCNSSFNLTYMANRLATKFGCAGYARETRHQHASTRCEWEIEKKGTENERDRMTI